MRVEIDRAEADGLAVQQAEEDTALAALARQPGADAVRRRRPVEADRVWLLDDGVDDLVDGLGVVDRRLAERGFSHG